MTEKNPQDNKSNRRGLLGKTALRVALAAAGAVLSAGTLSACAETVPTTGDVHKQTNLDGGTLLGSALRTNPEARQIADAMQKAMDKAATDMAIRMVDDYEHPKEDASPSLVARRTSDGKGGNSIIEYELIESFPTEDRAVTFGVKDGKIDLGNVLSVRAIVDDQPVGEDQGDYLVGRQLIKELDLTKNADGSSTWSYDAIPASEGEYASPGFACNIDSNNRPDTMDQLKTQEWQLYDQLNHF